MFKPTNRQTNKLFKLSNIKRQRKFLLHESKPQMDGGIGMKMLLSTGDSVAGLTAVALLNIKITNMVFLLDSFHGRIATRPGAWIGSDGSCSPAVHRLRRRRLQRTPVGQQQVRGAQEDGGGFAGRAGAGGQIRFAHENARGE